MPTDDKLTLKVAARYAAGPRPMKEEKMLLLLGKIRKMKEKSSLQGKEMSQVFDYLGGWKVEEGKAFANPRRTWGADSLRGGFYGELDKVEAELAKIKKKEEAKLPDPDSLSVGTTVYLDVSEIGPDKDRVGFTYTPMVVYSTIVVTSPDRKTHTILDRDLSQWPSEYMSNSGVLKWLNTTTFYDQVNSKLGTVSIEQEREEAKKKIPTRENTGTCGCCFGNFKLTKKARHGKDKNLPGMVLHGYQRPGHGYINGNCTGQDWPPFELSKEITELTLAAREDALKKEEETVKRWKTNPPEEIFEVSYVNNKMEKLRKEDMSEYDWNRKVKEQTRKHENLAGALESDIRFLKMQLRGWEIKPLPGTGPTPLLRGFQISEEGLHPLREPLLQEHLVEVPDERAGGRRSNLPGDLLQVPQVVLPHVAFEEVVRFLRSLFNGLKEVIVCFATVVLLRLTIGEHLRIPDLIVKLPCRLA